MEFSNKVYPILENKKGHWDLFYICFSFSYMATIELGIMHDKV